MKPIKINRNSWTYKLMRMVYSSESKMPQSRCGYTWTFLFSLITFPIWCVSLHIKHIDSIVGRVYLGAVMWIVGSVALIIILTIIMAMGIYLFVDLATAFASDPDMIMFVTIYAWIGYLFVAGWLSKKVANYYNFNFKSWIQSFRIEYTEVKDFEEVQKKSFWKRVCRPIEYVDGDTDE